MIKAARRRLCIDAFLEGKIYYTVIIHKMKGVTEGVRHEATSVFTKLFSQTPMCGRGAP
jgi:hypothetical protein